MGWMPIAGEEFLFEMTVCALLLPNADGVPTWNPERAGEKMMVKRPRQFQDLMKANEGKPMSEEIGEAMARWAAGGAAEATDTYRIPAGPHKGKTLQELGDVVLSGFIANPKISDAVKALIEVEIGRRVEEETETSDG